MAMELQREVGLSDTEFRMLCDLLREHCGLHFDEDARFLLEKRLSRRIVELGLGSFAAYHYLLRSETGGEDELSWVVDELTVNESWFLRERRQLRALVEEILPELRERRGAAGPPISLWSAGCSTGEEPYSIVMMGLEAGLVPGRDFRVYASDVSRRVLQHARRGVYRPAALRDTEPQLRQRHFQEADGLFRLSDEVKRQVVFTHLNLLDANRIGLLGCMDVILCRNVLIYFDLETRRRVIHTFEERTRPGGYLLLGHSESLVNVSNAFDLHPLRSELVYRRPAPGDPPRDLLREAASVARTEGLEG